ncbi:MAG: aminotransferase class V-fold PLP-dependent enzyme [Gammaproteobacteria bacterium]|nr:aminotransferase class V-fold PLP-dependent enzyme [Gammaproteobacteria bacterium]
MRIKRTIPPTAAPIPIRSFYCGIVAALSGQKYINKLESEFKKYFGVKHVFFVSSGKAALTTILSSLKTVDDRREVVIPAYTCFSVPSAVIKSGLTVELCDIDINNFDFNYDFLEKKLSQKTLCVIPSNLFGIPSNVDKLRHICNENDIYLIEDAAQAMGCLYNKKPLGTIGEAGFFSLGRGKNITSGSGGVIVTNSDKIASAIKSNLETINPPGFIENVVDYIQFVILSIFIRPSLYWLPSGLPFLELGKTFYYKEFPVKKLSAMKAGLLRGWETNLEKSNNHRIEVARYYSKNSEISHPYLRYPVVLNSSIERDKVFKISEKIGLGLSKMYPTTINKIEEIKDLFSGQDFPMANQLEECLITLPTHHWLTKSDKDAISKLIEGIDDDSDNSGMS